MHKPDTKVDAKLDEKLDVDSVDAKNVDSKVDAK